MCNISGRLLIERKRLKLSQQEMADIGGVAKRTYCNYESGEREPTGSFFTAIAKSGADISFILTGIRMAITGNANCGEDLMELNGWMKELIDNLDRCSDEDRAMIQRIAFIAAKVQASGEK
jgi:transcriptional regulator with XRE-family HTH domain